MKVDIHISTDSIEEGRRMLRALEGLLTSGAQVSYGVQPEVPPGGLLATLAHPAWPDDANQRAATPDEYRVAQAAMAAAAAAPAPVEQPRRGRKKAEAAPAGAGPQPEVAAEEQPALPLAGPDAGEGQTTSEEAEDIQPEPPAEETKAVTEDDIRRLLNKLAGLTSVPSAMEVLKQSGHAKIKDVPEGKRANLALLLESAIGKAEAERKAA